MSLAAGVVQRAERVLPGQRPASTPAGHRIHPTGFLRRAGNRFKTADEAAAGMHAISRRYKFHATEARAVGAAYFEAGKVLGAPVGARLRRGPTEGAAKMTWGVSKSRCGLAELSRAPLSQRKT